MMKYTDAGADEGDAAGNGGRRRLDAAMVFEVSKAMACGST